MVRFWWADGSDVFLAERRLAGSMLDQCKDWDSIHWDEGFFENEDEAFQVLVHEIEMPSMFSPGKVVWTHGIPSYHAMIANEIARIPEGILFVLIAKTDKTLRLFQQVVALGNLARIDEPLSLSGSNIVEWAQSRANDVGSKIDEAACRMLAGRVGFDANLLTSEIKKLALLVEDGITPWTVEQAAYGSGEINIFEIMNCALSGNRKAAHEKMRHIVSIEGAEKITGLLMDAARRMAIAEGIGRDHSASSVVLGNKKRDNGFKIREHSISVADFNMGVKPKKTPIAMFKDTKGIYRSCQDVSSKPSNWGYYVVLQTHEAIMSIRKGKDPLRTMENFLESIMGPSRKG